MAKTSMSAFLMLVLATAAAAPRAGLPFIRDDYTRAISEAKQRKVPMFVEVSAPW